MGTGLRESRILEAKHAFTVPIFVVYSSESQRHWSLEYWRQTIPLQFRYLWFTVVLLMTRPSIRSQSVMGMEAGTQFSTYRHHPTRIPRPITFLLYTYFAWLWFLFLNLSSSATHFQLSLSTEILSTQRSNFLYNTNTWVFRNIKICPF